ncbi:hypothetical protein QOT17_022185 [Balamuthia mandrillaris]
MTQIKSREAIFKDHFDSRTMDNIEVVLKDNVGPVVDIIGELGSEEISKSLGISEKGKVATTESAPELQKSKDNSKELMFCSQIIVLGIVECMFSKGNVVTLLVWDLLVENSTNIILECINSNKKRGIRSRNAQDGGELRMQ